MQTIATLHHVIYNAESCLPGLVVVFPNQVETDHEEGFAEDWCICSLQIQV